MASCSDGGLSGAGLDDFDPEDYDVVLCVRVDCYLLLNHRKTRINRITVDFIQRTPRALTPPAAVFNGSIVFQEKKQKQV